MAQGLSPKHLPLSAQVISVCALLIAILSHPHSTTGSGTEWGGGKRHRWILLYNCAGSFIIGPYFPRGKGNNDSWLPLYMLISGHRIPLRQHSDASPLFLTTQVLVRTVKKRCLSPLMDPLAISPLAVPTRGRKLPRHPKQTPPTWQERSDPHSPPGMYPPFLPLGGGCSARARLPTSSTGTRALPSSMRTANMRMRIQLVRLTSPIPPKRPEVRP